MASRQLSNVADTESRRTNYVRQTPQMPKARHGKEKTRGIAHSQLTAPSLSVIHTESHDGPLGRQPVTETFRFDM